MMVIGQRRKTGVHPLFHVYTCVLSLVLRGNTISPSYLFQARVGELKMGFDPKIELQYSQSVLNLNHFYRFYFSFATANISAQ